MNPIFFPLQWYSLMLVELSDTLIACQFKSIAKQLSLRVNSWQSGSLDLLFVMLLAPLGYFGKYNSIFKNSLYDAVDPVVRNI